MIPDLVIVALDFYREPGRFAALTSAGGPLPPGLSELLAAPAKALSEEHIEQTAETLNASVDECRDCVPFFIKQVLLDAGGDYYRMLGVSRDADVEEIKRHYHYLMRLFHPDRDVAEDNWDDLYAPRINEAYAVLRNSNRRREYDATLRQDDGFSPAAIAQPASGAPPVPPRMEPAPQGGGLSPRARWVAGGLALAAVMVFVGLISLQTRQPTLRVDEHSLAQGGESDETLPTLRVDIAKEKGALRLQTTVADEPAPEPVKKHEPLKQRSSRQNADQRVEDIVKARVERATVAVLGPRKSTPGSKPTREPHSEPEGPAAQELIAEASGEPGSGHVAEPQLAASLSEQPATELAGAVHSQPIPEEQQQSAEWSQAGEIEPTIAATVEPSAVVTAATTEATKAPAIAVAAVSVASDVPSEISSGDLALLLKQLTASYEAGNALVFSELFMEDAKTSDASGRAEIQAMYARFFAQPEARQMVIRNFSWQKVSHTKRSGSGVALVTTSPFNGDEPATGSLSLRLDVVRFGTDLRIAGMYYHYQ